MLHLPSLLQAAPAPSPFSNIFMMVMLVGFAYLFLIRPVQQQRKQQEEMRSALKPGDKILTIGGLHATVVKLEEDRIRVRIAEGVQVDLARSAVSSVRQADE